MRRIAVGGILAAGIALLIGPSVGAQTSTVSVVVDVNAGRQAISPLVYGWNGEASVDQPGSQAGGFAATLAATRPGLVRIGGNRLTAFNWESNDSNAGSDYLYENDDYLSSSTTPGDAILGTLQATKAIGAATLVTVPIGPYVAGDRLGPVDHGATVDTSRFKQNVATGPLTTTPVTSDGFVYENQFVDWAAHAVPGAKILYSLDNEVNDWATTHAEVHPAHVTYDELVNNDVTYATMIKATYAKLHLPAPLVTGPVLDGFQGQEDAANGDGSSTDYATHGRFVDYYLDHMRAADKAARKRLVDMLDVHWYPEVAPGLFNLEHDPDQVAAREQAPRSLWDTGYTEDSWVAGFVGGPIALIPRLKSEIAKRDPGLGLAITEWNYGGGEDISGGIATADTLGIFGRYGMSAATYWPQFQPSEDWAFGAFRMFRNFDGNGGSFGNTEVSATDSDTSQTSAYASIDAANPKHAVVVLINKKLTSAKFVVQLKHYVTTGKAAMYTLTAASPDPQPAEPLVASAADTFTVTMPAQSVAVIVPKPALPAPAFYADDPPDAVIGVPYSYTFGATGTPPPSFAAEGGSLPAGLTLSSGGVLSGVPTAAGTATFSVLAVNGAGLATTPRLKVVTVQGAAPAFTAAAPPGGGWEESYAYTFKASGTPAPTFGVSSGSLPPGLTLDPASGALTGAPTAVGDYSFAVTASNDVLPDAVTATLHVSIAKPPAGTVLSWGSDSGGQLGNGNRVGASTPSRIDLPGGATAVQVAAGDEHSLALTAAGQVYAWGNDICGEIGDGHDGSCNTDKPVRTPYAVQFPGGTPAIVQVAAGSKDSLALDADGNVWGWGDDGVGELGDAATGVTRDTPVAAHLGAWAGHVVAIAANGYATAALTDDGNVLTWGSGVQGALGNGSDSDTDVPGLANLGGAAGTITAIAAGGAQAGHVIALTTGNLMVGWGNNAQGQVGDGTTTDRWTAVGAGPTSVLSIGGGSYQSFALTSDGKVWAWGNNGYGELGTGTASDHEADPVQAFGGLSSVAQVSGGDFFSLARTAAGAIYGVGIGDSGQLGNAAILNSPTPVQAVLPSGTTISSVSAGAAFGLALVG